LTNDWDTAIVTDLCAVICYALKIENNLIESSHFLYIYWTNLHFMTDQFSFLRTNLSPQALQAQGDLILDHTNNDTTLGDDGVDGAISLTHVTSL
ncbi:hypothetical protein ACJX0J_018144, partial [Zea mays]